jgi:ATP-binding protein involved in chromosome partitioning
MVENMSGDIFGRGGARQKAAELGVPFLGEVPTEARIRIDTDEGNLAGLFAEDNPAREPLLHVCEQTAMEIARQLLEGGQPDMPTLEIL